MFFFVFVLEALIKLVGLGGTYFKDGWNIFDFGIVLSTGIAWIIEYFMGSNIGSQATLLRTFRVGRLLKLANSAKQLKMIFSTLIVTIPSLVNVGFLLFLMIFLYSIIGINLFGTIKINGLLDEHANFQSFGMALLTLIRITTFESWNGIMHATMRTNSLMFDCINNPTY